MNRRLFLRNTLAGTTAIAITPSAFLTSCGGTIEPPELGIGSVGGLTVPAPPFTNDFESLDTLSASGAAITASKNFAIFLGTTGTYCYGYSNTIWGPTLTANTGDSVNITLTAELTQDTNMHFHGLTLNASEHDGVEDAVADGSNKTYSFTVNNRAGMYWYHPQYKKTTGVQMGSGLGGCFIVSDSEEDALNLPAGNLRSSVISIQDKRFNEDNMMYYSPNPAESMSGFYGGTIMVNGVNGPVKNVSSRIHRLRIINGSTARIYNFSLGVIDGDEIPFNVIGNDGGLLDNLGGSINSIILAPGERVDTLVDFSGLTLDTEIMLSSKQFNGAGDYQGSVGFDIMKFVISVEEPETWSLPDDLSDITELTEGDVTGETRTFDVANGNISKEEATNNTDTMHTINGDTYEAGVSAFTVNSGAVEKWIIDNTGGSEPRVMHIYGVQFQLFAREGGRASVKQWERGWKDTVCVFPDEKVTLIVPFNAAAGTYHMVSTNIEHADTGLMNTFEIV